MEKGPRRRLRGPPSRDPLPPLSAGSLLPPEWVAGLLLARSVAEMLLALAIRVALRPLLAVEGPLQLMAAVALMALQLEVSRRDVGQPRPPSVAARVAVLVVEVGRPP